MLFSGILLFLAALLLWHGEIGGWSLFPNNLGGKPVAVINGESISQEDFQARSQKLQTLVERQYGKGIFSGQRGKVLLEDLKAGVLEEMLQERLIEQEARRLGIQVSQEKVGEELQRLAKEVFGSQENFQKRLEEGGIQGEELQGRIRNLLLAEGVKADKSHQGEDPEALFDTWLVQARQNARVEISDSVKSIGYGAAGFGGCCNRGRGSGGCGVLRDQGNQADPQTEEKAKKAGLEAFQKSNPGEKEVTAKVIDYGCHIQVDIQKDGRVVKSYTYQDGKVFEDS
jgi:hypothetical protein